MIRFFKGHIPRIVNCNVQNYMADDVEKNLYLENREVICCLANKSVLIPHLGRASILNCCFIVVRICVNGSTTYICDRYAHCNVETLREGCI